MPFGLTMGTERANALQVCSETIFLDQNDQNPFFSCQQSIQDELIKRGYSPEAGESMQLSTVSSC